MNRAVKKMPKQVSGMPAKQKATPRDITRITGTFLARGESLKVTEAKNRSLRLATLTEGKWLKDLGRYELRKNGAFWSTRTPGTSIRSDKRGAARTGIGAADEGPTRPGFTLSPAWQNQ